MSSDRGQNTKNLSKAQSHKKIASLRAAFFVACSVDGLEYF